MEKVITFSIDDFPVTTLKDYPIKVKAIKDKDMIKAIAKNNHHIWARHMIEKGWKYGKIRDDEQKTTPDLIPFDSLPKEEQERREETTVEIVDSIFAIILDADGVRSGMSSIVQFMKVLSKAIYIDDYNSLKRM